MNEGASVSLPGIAQVRDLAVDAPPGIAQVRDLAVDALPGIAKVRDLAVDALPGIANVRKLAGIDDALAIVHPWAIARTPF